MCICVCIHFNLYVYVYVYIERGKGGGRRRERESNPVLSAPASQVGRVFLFNPTLRINMKSRTSTRKAWSK